MKFIKLKLTDGRQIILNTSRITTVETNGSDYLIIRLRDRNYAVSGTLDKFYSELVKNKK